MKLQLLLLLKIYQASSGAGEVILSAHKDKAKKASKETQLCAKTGTVTLSYSLEVVFADTARRVPSLDLLLSSRCLRFTQNHLPLHQDSASTHPWTDLLSASLEM